MLINDTMASFPNLRPQKLSCPLWFIRGGFIKRFVAATSILTFWLT